GALQAPVWRRLLPWAVALGLTITLCAYLQAAIRPFPLPVRLDPIARQLGGWDGLATRIAERAAGADFVASDQYGLAAESARCLPVCACSASMDAGAPPTCRAPASPASPGCW